MNRCLVGWPRPQRRRSRSHGKQRLTHQLLYEGLPRRYAHDHGSTIEGSKAVLAPWTSASKPLMGIIKFIRVTQQLVQMDSQGS